jgi:hypothetical protein
MATPVLMLCCRNPPRPGASAKFNPADVVRKAQTGFMAMIVARQRNSPAFKQAIVCIKLASNHRLMCSNCSLRISQSQASPALGSQYCCANAHGQDPGEYVIRSRRAVVQSIRTFASVDDMTSGAAPCGSLLPIARSGILHRNTSDP